MSDLPFHSIWVHQSHAPALVFIMLYLFSVRANQYIMVYPLYLEAGLFFFKLSLFGLNLNVQIP